MDADLIVFLVLIGWIVSICLFVHYSNPTNKRFNKTKLVREMPTNYLIIEVGDTVYGCNSDTNKIFSGIVVKLIEDGVFQISRKDGIKVTMLLSEVIRLDKGDEYFKSTASGLGDIL